MLRSLRRSLPGHASQDPWRRRPGAGAGQTIAIVDAYHDPNIVGDLSGFSTQFSLPQMDGLAGDPTFRVKYINGGNNDSVSPTPPPTDNGWSSEIALDVEWAHAIAP